MPFYLCRLNPPRPSFATEMSDRERQLMEEHGVYWSAELARGRVVVFGLVADPAGPWGTVIVEVEDRAAAEAMTNGDPVIRRGEGFSYDILPMPNAVRAGREHTSAPA